MTRGLAVCLATLGLARAAAAAPGEPARDPAGPLEVSPVEPTRDPAGPLEVTPVEPAPADLPPKPAPTPPAEPPSDLSEEPGHVPPADLSEEPAGPAPFGRRGHQRDRIGRLPAYFGLGAGVGLTRRTVGDTELRAVTGHGALHGRLAGYSQRTGRSRRVSVMLLPELQLNLELGGTAATPPAGHGVMVGASGIFAIGAAWASAGRIGVYVALSASQRGQARLHTDLEGAYYLAAPGITTGLRVHRSHAYTLLIGGGADGWIGAQRFLDRGRLIAQLAPVGQLAIFSEPRNVYFGIVGRAGATALGHLYGGSRVHGRATAEVMWRVSKTGRIKLATVLLAYDGARIVAAPDHPQFDPAGERRTSHQLLLAGGIAF